MTDDRETTPEAPAEIWAVYRPDDPFGQCWGGGYYGVDICGFASREDAEDDLDEGWSVALVGISPAWRARAEAAEAEVGRLNARLSQLRRIIVTDPVTTRDEIQALEPGNKADDCFAITVWNVVANSKARREHLSAEVERLKSAIRDHRDQRGDDRCWLDDAILYEAIGEPIPIDGSALPPREDFLKSCERYYEQRRCPLDVYPPGKMRIAELESEVDRLKMEVETARQGSALLRSANERLAAELADARGGTP